MEFEKSCGAIVFKKCTDEIYFLVLQHFAGHWSFPKGHVENGESEVETALREVKEETGLVLSIDDHFRIVNTYSPRANILKEVVYFIAKSDKSIVHFQEDEIKSMRWCSYHEALKLITFNSDKSILTKANNYLKIIYSNDTI